MGLQQGLLWNIPILKSSPSPSSRKGWVRRLKERKPISIIKTGVSSVISFGKNSSRETASSLKINPSSPSPPLPPDFHLKHGFFLKIIIPVSSTRNLPNMNRQLKFSPIPHKE